METQLPVFLRQRRAGQWLRLHPRLPHLSSDPIRAWRLPTASKPAPVRNTCSRRILPCALTICLSMDLSCLEHLMSICCLRSCSLLRTRLALVFQIQRHSRSDEKSFFPAVSMPSLAISIKYKIPRGQPTTEPRSH